MTRIIECVPNFSEGRRKETIECIVGAIRNSGGVSVLNVDPGEGANRTVVTFAGSPEAVVEAAFQGVRVASERIDMRFHKGTHPRIGATDVLPLVPISGISLEECAELAKGLAERMFTELGIPCYCYEAAAFRPEMRNLAVCRAGEYESLPAKIANPDDAPDFCPKTFTLQAAKSGASVVGARDFLIAVNFNLNSSSVKTASQIALDVREKGRQKKDPLTGETVFDSDGKPLMVPGKLKRCKAIGWYIEEYGFAQVSMNITDIRATPLHRAFEEVSRAAAARGLEVTGTEIIGLVPEKVLLEAGKHFLASEYAFTTAASDAAPILCGTTGSGESAGNGTSAVCTETAPSPAFEDKDLLISTAIKAMGLDSLRPFNPNEKIIERLLAAE